MLYGIGRLWSGSAVSRPCSVFSGIKFMHLAIEVLVWFSISTCLMSFVEHFIHSKLMHKNTLLAKRFPPLTKVYYNHAALHHSQYYKNFCDAPVAPGQDRHI